LDPLELGVKRLALFPDLDETLLALRERFLDRGNGSAQAAVEEDIVEKGAQEARKDRLEAVHADLHVEDAAELLLRELLVAVRAADHFLRPANVRVTEEVARVSGVHPGFDVEAPLGGNQEGSGTSDVVDVSGEVKDALIQVDRVFGEGVPGVLDSLELVGDPAHLRRVSGSKASQRDEALLLE